MGGDTQQVVLFVVPRCNLDVIVAPDLEVQKPNPGAALRRVNVEFADNFLVAVHGTAWGTPLRHFTRSADGFTTPCLRFLLSR